VPIVIIISVHLPPGWTPEALRFLLYAPFVHDSAVASCPNSSEVDNKFIPTNHVRLPFLILQFADITGNANVSKHVEAGRRMHIDGLSLILVSIKLFALICFQIILFCFCAFCSRCDMWVYSEYHVQNNWLLGKTSLRNVSRVCKFNFNKRFIFHLYSYSLFYQSRSTAVSYHILRSRKCKCEQI